MKTLKTDVIIPAYRPGEEFEKLLERLSAQKYPINKILVMNTEKKFWKETWEQEYPLVEVRHLTKEEFDHGGTRRQAAELSDAEILVFMTQDAMPADRELIGALVGALAENPQAGAAYARQLPKKDCRFLEKYTRSFNYPEQSCLKTEKDVQTYGIKTYFCSNVCAAYDHRIYDEIGGFPEHAIFNEDMIYAGWMVKKGYGVAYVSGEGIRLVKKSMAYLLKTGHIWLIPGLFLQSVSKYAGYFLGKRYKKLPEKMIRSCTMNPEYWKKNK